MVRNSVSRNGKTYVYYMCGNNRANHACTSHRISESVLEDSVFHALKQHIEVVLNIERVLKYIETLPFRQEEMQKVDAQLVKKKEETERYSRLKKSLYESMMDGLINKAEYLELKAVYDTKMQEAQEAEAKLIKDMENLLKNRSGNAAWIERFRQHQNLTELTRHIAVTLIERIDVYEGCCIKIYFKYQDSYECALALIEGMNQLRPLGGMIETSCQESMTQYTQKMAQAVKKPVHGMEVL